MTTPTREPLAGLAERLRERMAWRFTGIAGLKRYLPDSAIQYAKARGCEWVKWYEPYYCAHCLEITAENQNLRKLLAECADDLEVEMQERYRHVADHPAMAHKIKRDLEPVVRARTALSPSDTVEKGEGA